MEMVQDALNKLRKKLLDLTARNKLLNWKETSSTIRIIDELPAPTFDRLVLDGKPMALTPLPEPEEEGDEDRIDEPPPLFDFRSNKRLSNRVSSTNTTQSEPITEQERLKNEFGILLSKELPTDHENLAKKHTDVKLQTPFYIRDLEARSRRVLQNARSAIEETGTNMLYLAIGFLEWREAKDSSKILRAPLLLVPLMIERTRMDKKSNCYKYAISYTGEDFETNLSLSKRLDLDFNLILPEVDDGVDPEAYLAKVEEVTVGMKKWRIAREMVVGLFSFAKMRMYRDLDPANWPADGRLSEHTLVRKLLGAEEPGDSLPFGEDESLGNENEDEFKLVLDADVSQRATIKHAMMGRSMVVIGPPGTGKSQTITNLIAAAISAGKTVLFVSEKMAALDVVRRRLDQVNLGRFCLELHSWKTQKKRVLDDIRMRLNKKNSTKQNHSFDDAALTESRNPLDRYVALVNSPFGNTERTIQEILWSAERWREDTKDISLELSIESASLLSKREAERRAEMIQDIVEILGIPVPPDVEFWCGFRPTEFLPGDESKLIRIFEGMRNALKELEQLSNSDQLAESNLIEGDVGSLLIMADLEPDLLREYPENWESEELRGLVSRDNRKIIARMQRDVMEYRRTMAETTSVFTTPDAMTTKEVSETISNNEIFQTRGYSLKTFRDVISILKHQSIFERTVDALKTQFRILIDLGLKIPESIPRIEELLKICDQIRSIPTNTEQFIVSAHASNLSLRTFKEARAAFETLDSKFREHAEFFHLDMLPPEAELTCLANLILRKQNSWFKFLSPKLRRALKKVRSFTRLDSYEKSAGLPKRLQKVAALLKESEAAAKNPKWKLAFGPLFCGRKTNWNKLLELIKWSSRLRSEIGSKQITEKILDNIDMLLEHIPSTSSKIRSELDTLLTTLEKLRLSLPREARKNLRDDSTLELLIKNITEALSELTSCRDQMESFLKTPDVNLSSIKKAGAALRKAKQIAKSIKNSNDYKAVLPNSFDGINTPFENIYSGTKWIEQLELGGFTDGQINWMLKDAPQRCGLSEALIRSAKANFITFRQFAEKLGEFGKFNIEEMLETENREATISNSVLRMEEWISRIQEVGQLAEYVRLKNKAAHLGLERLTEALEKKEIPLPAAKPTYLRAYFDSLAREILREYPEIASFSRISHERLRGRFAELDEQKIKDNRFHIANAVLSRSVLQGVGKGYVKDYTELSLIEHELTKKKRHIPLRQLIRRSGCALQALKPCFMMSPLSVAQFLAPGNFMFDLVVMDEASQLRPEEALGAIARGKQAVIVGDPNQLPPTSFFVRTGEDAESEDQDSETAMDNAESILDVAKRGFGKSTMLNWHYRSRHERLITFSNRQFYEDDLVVFPSPKGTQGGLGIFLHYVENAQYYKGKNPKEAEVVAEAAIKQLVREPDKSLGIGTFNLDQRDLIQDRIDNLLKQNPTASRIIDAMDSSSEPFFVKNLENIQGDERDVIFVCTTYGPDRDTGTVFQRFGPINGAAGWRRLNVMFTRAKERIEVFTSMQSSDIVGGPDSRGAQVLKSYLEFAETGNFRDRGTETGKAPDSDFEISVARVLENLGYEAIPQVGVAGFFIDLGVRHPAKNDEFLIGIECDGASYHSSKWARDRDRLREAVLRNLGWEIHRIWSVDWFKNRHAEIARLERTLHDLMKKDRHEVRITE